MAMTKCKDRISTAKTYLDPSKMSAIDEGEPWPKGLYAPGNAGP
jgi:hypothetical protein